MHGNNAASGVAFSLRRQLATAGANASALSQPASVMALAMAAFAWRKLARFS